MSLRWRSGILTWVVIAGLATVGLTIVLLHGLDRQIIEQSGATNLHVEFLQATSAVSRIIGKSGDIHNVHALDEVFHDIFELRPNIRRLSVFELLQDSGPRIYSSDPRSGPTMLTDYERHELAAGRLVSYFYDEGGDRGWMIAAPIVVSGEVIGALRGRFSLSKYDQLIQAEGRAATQIGIGAAAFTSLVFVWLVRRKIQRPIHELLQAMGRAGGGDVTSRAPVSGPEDLQEVSRQFNLMLDRIRDTVVAKEQLLGEVQTFNTTLSKTVAETKAELQQSNQMVVEARARTERALKLAALGELSAVMAHELGNPLNAMSGHLQLLQKEMQSQESNRHLTIIREEITRMIATIQYILDSTRTEIRSCPVDLNAMIQDVQTLIAPSLAEHHIMLKIDLAPSLPLVAGDYRALHGVLFNLATNAIQAMSDGGELEIVTSLSDEGSAASGIFFQGAMLKGGAGRLTVRDSGCGITLESLPRIFEPFFTTRPAEGGTGLGLAVCQRVVASLGGRIGVESRLGQGTRFIVDLPRWNGGGEGGRSDED